jgi:hypothetical protein
MSRTLAALAALLLAGPAQLSAVPPPQQSVVNATDYDSFWLWAGVKPQPVLASARQVYILQGQISHHDPVQLTSQRPAIPRVEGPDVWMVVRVETLRWPPGLHDQLLAQLLRWRAAGNHVVGVQIDFDAGTRHLGEYAQFLGELRRRLPDDTKLGITGLLDWSANGDPEGLDALAGTVDEVVLQIYQGKRVIPGYGDYLARLDRLKVPFRIGLLQGGPWQRPPGLESNPNFKGYVVFLTNQTDRPIL